jgi:group I intron endonuclease
MAYVYEIVNLINNKKYIGFCSKTPDQSKNYYGSGILINSAIKKYGKQNFIKRIIKLFDTVNEARLYEEYLIQETNAIEDPNFYNLTKGGYGGFSETAKQKQKSIESRKKISESNKGRIVSTETRKKLSEKLKGTKPWNTGIPRSEETKKKLSLALKNKPLTDQHRQNISNAQKGRKYRITTCPYCNKSGGVNVMQKWHFDKCKHFSRISHL